MTKKRKIIITICVLLFACLVCIGVWQFDNIKNFILTRITVSGGTISEPLEPSIFPEEKIEPGLFDTNGNLSKSWQDFIDNEELCISENGVLSKSEKLDTNALVGNLVIPNTVVEISDSTFMGTAITSVIIPKSVKTIKPDAFSDCSNLKDVKVLGAENIGAYAFSNCWSLENISLSNSITYIGSNAFAGCEILKSIIIPEKITELSPYMFNSCYALESVYIAGSITSIGDYAFMGCSNLTDITLPNTITSLGEECFNGCTSFSSIYIPTSVTSIVRSFIRCSSNLILYFELSNIEDFNADIKFWNCYDLSDKCKLECKTGYTYNQYLAEITNNQEV